MNAKLLEDLKNALIKMDSLKREKKEIEYRIQKIGRCKIEDDLNSVFNNFKSIIDPALANQMTLHIVGDIRNLVKKSIKNLEDQIEKINSDMQHVEYSIKGIIKEMAD